MMQKQIALIGCGRIGFLLEDDPLRNKPCTHYGGLTSVGLKVTSACDLDRSRLKNFSQHAGIKKEHLYNSYQELFKNSTPDIAVISTWTESHANIAVSASESGVKIIVLEKPIASDLKSAEKIISSCKKSNTRIFINHERRYDFRYEKVKNLIDNGKIGEIKTVNASILTGGYRGNSNILEGGGPLMHDGTHLVDIIRFFFGEIESVQGNFQRNNRQKGFEDRAVAWLKSQSGIDIFLEAGGSRNYFVFELIISGNEGKIVIGNGYEHLYLAKKSKFYKGFSDLSEVNFPKYKKKSPFTSLYRDVKNSLNDKIHSTISRGEDGYRAEEKMDIEPLRLYTLYINLDLTMEKKSYCQLNQNLLKLIKYSIYNSG